MRIDDRDSADRPVSLVRNTHANRTATWSADQDAILNDAASESAIGTISSANDLGGQP